MVNLEFNREMGRIKTVYERDTSGQQCGTRVMKAFIDRFAGGMEKPIVPLQANRGSLGCARDDSEEGARYSRSGRRMKIGL
jgi:hypothetical protein